MEGSPHHTRQASVLVIDDDDVIRMVVRDALEFVGYTVHEANGPEIGLELAERVQPEIVMLDIMLPRIDGLKVLAHMRSIGLPCKVVIFSATGTRHAAEAFELGANEFLTKPFELDELIGIIDRLSSAVSTG